MHGQLESKFYVVYWRNVKVLIARYRFLIRWLYVHCTTHALFMLTMPLSCNNSHSRFVEWTSVQAADVGGEGGGDYLACEKDVKTGLNRLEANCGSVVCIDRDVFLNPRFPDLQGRKGSFSIAQKRKVTS